TAWFTRQAKMAAPPWLPWTTDKPISTWERVAQVVFGLFGLASLGAAAGSILTPFISVTPLADFLVNPFMVAGSAIKIGVLGLCALLVAIDVRRFTHHVQMITALVVGHAGSFVAIILVWLLGFSRFGDYSFTLAGMTFTREQMMLGAWLLDVVIIGGFLFLNGRINRVLLDFIGFLNPTQFRALEAIAETLVAGKDAEIVPPHQIVLRT